ESRPKPPRRPPRSPALQRIPIPPNPPAGENSADRSGGHSQPCEPLVFPAMVQQGMLGYASSTCPHRPGAMMNDDRAPSALSRRDLFRMIGVTAGSAAMYQAMSALG